jgi:hypothetical protein
LMYTTVTTVSESQLRYTQDFCASGLLLPPSRMHERTERCCFWVPRDRVERTRFGFNRKKSFRAVIEDSPFCKTRLNLCSCRNARASAKRRPFCAGLHRVASQETDIFMHTFLQGFLFSCFILRCENTQTYPVA